VYAIAIVARPESDMVMFLDYYYYYYFYHDDDIDI